MQTWLIAYFATIIPFLIIDAIWLGVVATNFFQSRIGHLMADTVNLPAAAGFYLFYGVGIVYFAIQPALQGGGIGLALFNGMLLGLLCYGTYDMTNYATLKDYPLSMVLVDVTWGAFLTALSAGIGYFAVKSFQ